LELAVSVLYWLIFQLAGHGKLNSLRPRFESDKKVTRKLAGVEIDLLSVKWMPFIGVY